MKAHSTACILDSKILRPNHMSDTKIIKKCLESRGIRCCSHVGWRVCWHLPQNLSHLQLGASSRLRQPCLVRPQTWVIIQSSDNYPYFFHLFPHIQLGDGHSDRLKIFMVPISSGCQLLVPSHRARLGCLEMAKNTSRCWKCWEVYALSVEFSWWFAYPHWNPPLNSTPVRGHRGVSPASSNRRCRI